MLIAAASGRALAASAVRAGYAPLVADMFGDQDTLAVAADHARIVLRRPVDGNALMAALEALADGHDCAGVVCGSGFEDRPDLMTRIGARWPLRGNGADTIATLKDPLRFAALCREIGIPHPQIVLTPPPDSAGWLVKRIGGAGGLHVRPATAATKAGDGYYFQRRVAGTPVSALLLGDGRDVMVLGFSAQWAAPTPRYPFRYGGAVRPAALADGMTQLLTAAIRRLNAAIPLTGLSSVDFLIDGGAFHLLEVNPRPSATFDLFESDTPLFKRHMDASAGALPEQAPVFDDAMAAAIVYAERAIAAVPDCDWPEWTADRPVPGSRIDIDDPVCTVYARAATAEQAKQRVAARAAQIHALVGERVS